jgi:hypothetical protein
MFSRRVNRQMIRKTMKNKPCRLKCLEKSQYDKLSETFEVTQVVEHLPTKCETLNSNPYTAGKKILVKINLVTFILLFISNGAIITKE